MKIKSRITKVAEMINLRLPMEILHTYNSVFLDTRMIFNRILCSFSLVVDSSKRLRNQDSRTEATREARIRILLLPVLNIVTTAFKNFLRNLILDESFNSISSLRTKPKTGEFSVLSRRLVISTYCRITSFPVV